MGLFDKLKNALFEEEEVEIKEKKEEVNDNVSKFTFEEPKEEIPEVVVEEPVVEEPKKVEVVEEVIEDTSSFKFQDFDEEEFDKMKDSEISKKTMGLNLFDYDIKEKMPEVKEEAPELETIRGRVYDEETVEEIKNRKFRPSPVISPVYGVKDKDYRKEDIEVVKESKKQIDVDEVRKKAFGRIEEEKEIVKEDRVSEPIIEEKDDFKDTLEIPKVKEKVKPKEEALEDNDTLENDLFDLIDSMYENKED